MSAQEMGKIEALNKAQAKRILPPEKAQDWLNRLKRSPIMHGDVQVDPMLEQEIRLWLEALAHKEVSHD